MSKDDPAKVSKKSGLVIIRVFDAPVEQVWKAWTEPERVKRWWGAEKLHLTYL